ncbi:MAG: nitrous oxide reductase accessory protein NosL [Hyphomicrobiales bacterium]
MIMHRRDFLMTASAGAIAATTFGIAARAEEMKMQMPWDWTDEHGLVRNLPKDTDPLTDEFKKYPRCPYCGMVRQKFSFSRHLIVYEDDTVDGTCSIHCAGISLALNMDRGPKTIYVGDAGADGEVKPLIDSAAATYAINPNKPGTMTARSKFAFSDKAKAEASGGELTDFNGALRAAYADMAEDSIRIRKNRAEKRRKAG